MTEETNGTEEQVKNEETNGTEEQVKNEVAPTSLGKNSRLAKLLAQSKVELPSVLEVMDTVMGDNETAIKSDTVFEQAKNLFEKMGLMDKYLQFKGVETTENISEWRPVLAAINSGKGKSASDLRHLDLNVMYNYGTKTPVNLDDKFFPVFVHGEEVLTDASGMVVEDRIMVMYNSAQKAKEPGYNYQNIVYLLNSALNEIYKITVKSAGHKYATNLLRNFMHTNYSQGLVFDITRLKSWLKLEVISHTSKAGFTNPYPKLTVDQKELTSDEAKVVNLVQRVLFEDFHKTMAVKKESADSENATEALVENSTSTDDAGANFTNI